MRRAELNFIDVAAVHGNIALDRDAQRDRREQNKQRKGKGSRYQLTLSMITAI